MSDLTEPVVGIELSAKRVLSYAMAHNQIPVVNWLRLTSSTDIDGAVLRLSVRDAEGAVTAAFERVVDLAASAPTLMSQVDLAADPAAMLQVDEQRPATIVAEVVHREATVATHSAPIQLLAARQWLRDPELLSMELLAAFVMPNDPAVAELVDEASALLQARTGSPSIQGYQSGPERVDAIARALFDAMQARDVRYANPPASWADVGQKIRTPSEVLTGRIGTCLDTVVVLAAALEQAGIRPLLWLVNGHAFLGYWREESALDAIVQTDVADLVNFIDLGLVRLIETTMVTASDEPATFDDAARPPYITYLTGDMPEVLGVTDVWTARRSGIVPLPARTRSQDGHIQVVEYRAAEHSTAKVARRTATTPEAQRAAAAVPPRVQQWKNTLLDLSLRNRLINYTERAGIALHVPDGYLGAVEDMLHEREAVQLLPADHLDEVHTARGAAQGAALPQTLLAQLLTTKHQLFTAQGSAGYATRMRGLAYKARTIIEETGANNLYLALGSLVWEIDGKSLRSPLILVPVKLLTRAKTTAYRLELDESGTSTPNYCLLEKLHQLHGMRVPGLAEPATDGAGIDLDSALQSMRLALAEKGLRYRVEPTADLAILQFAKFRLWKDLDEHWETLSSNPLVKHLIHTPTEPFLPTERGEAAPVDLDALDAMCPVPGDESQLHAVADAVAGRTFVLEGPPGTGKSQTITNLLTRAVAEGKRVLFVAEKRAALDVVRSRLDTVGMGPFCLDLHDKGSKPAVVRAQIRTALEHDVAVDAQGLSAQQEDLRSSRRTLSRYADRLHETNTVDLSFYTARTQLLALGEGAVLPVPRAVLSGDNPGARVTHIANILRTLPDSADAARPAAGHPWGFVALDDTDRLDVEAVRSAVLAVDRSLDALPITGPVVEALLAVRTADDLSALASILQAPGVPLTVLDATRTPGWHEASAGLSRELQAFVAAAHPGLDLATPSALDLPLADIHAQAQTAAASSWFGRSKRLKAVLAQLTPALKPGASVKPKAVPELTAALLQLQGSVRALAGRASGVAGLAVPPTWNPLTEEGQRLVSSQVSWLTWAGNTVDAAAGDHSQQGFVAALRRFMDSGHAADAAAAASIQQHAHNVRQLAAVCDTTPAVLDHWCGQSGLLRRWAETRDRRDVSDPALLGLRRWVAFLDHLRPLRSAGLDAARDLLVTGEVHADDASRAFERGLAQTSVEERREATGLDGFDAVSHNKTIQRFTGSAAAVRQQMKTAVPAQVLTSRPFQPSTARGQVGALQRELNRQRGGLGVRALLSTYGDLVTQLMPCVLVSPDSLSRFFPVGQQAFDLVVFDEASQIRVADAIGAMGRSNAVVVVGDSKQMPPTSFAEATAGAGEDDEPLPDDLVATADEESILTECVLARVPRRWLSWHYRSQDESLIAFSNHHYYDGRLSSFPAPSGGRAHAGIDGFGISLVPVPGTFHRSGKGKLLRTNPAEAEAVVDEIRRRFEASPSSVPSIGVVTFNQQQRAYIEGLLRDAGDERLVEALDSTEEEGLFIKNLENVQGDERDVILFSTAFSVNDRGVLPLNFGPLNRAGGERRLNVAVTRARRQVVIFSSFAPAQLRAEETSSIGIKHLRAYLDLAERGTTSLQAATRSSAAPDRHRQEVAEALRQRGLVVREELGLSDFKVELSLSMPDDPERLLVAVLLDGEGWRRRGTVGDRDGLPVQVLSKMLRWPAVERVWLPEWLAASDEVVSRLERAVQAAVDAPQPSSEPEPRFAAEESTPSPFAGLWNPDLSSAVPAAGAASPVLTSVVSSRSSALPGEEPFIAWTPRNAGNKDVLDRLPSTAQQVRRLIEEIVTAEGPIHHERLAKLVGSSFGLSRVAATRAGTIIEQIPPALIPNRAEPFAWPAHRQPLSWTGFRRSSTEDPRTVDAVSLRELGNAMVAIGAVSYGIDQEELLRETLAVLGGRRLTPTIEARLTQALKACVREGRLVNSNGLFVPA